MASREDKANALADKITAEAEDCLRPLEWRMSKWPAEFRSIVWGAVADIANKRRVEAELNHAADARRTEGA